MKITDKVEISVIEAMRMMRGSEYVDFLEHIIDDERMTATKTEGGMIIVITRA